MMSWGIELWDQFDNISIHTQKGLEYCDKLVHFYKERCAIENEYATKLKKLVKTFSAKKRDEDEFTCQRGFQGSLKEVYDMAGQHEAISEGINNIIIKEISTFMLDYKQQRKKLLQDGTRQQALLSAQMDKLERAKKKYEKAFNEAEKAVETYRKNEQDINLAKIDIEKSKTVMLNRQQVSDDCKAEYALEVQNTKKAQSEHYERLMPEIFQQLQNQEEGRVQKIRELLETSSKIEKEVLPIIGKCIDGFSTSARIINPAEDSRLFIDKFKTGFQFPTDIPFEDLSLMNSGSSGSFSKLSSSNKSRKKPGLFSFLASRQEESKEDFSHLPPNQQRKQLLCKIDSIKAALQKDCSERDALSKMKEVYLSNKSLGDPASLDKQLAETAVKINKLEQELHKYESYMLDNQNRSNNSPNASPAVMRRDHDDTISTSSRVSSISNTYTTPVKPQSPIRIHNDSFSDDDEGKMCSALYDYEGTGDESSLAMMTGEKFALIKDEGDGWLNVKRVTTGEVGYIPSSYVQFD